MDHKYANSNFIFGIYIHVLAYVPIFKAFAHFLAELLTLTKLCHLCHLWHKWHKFVNVNNSARKCANALKIEIWSNLWL